MRACVRYNVHGMRMAVLAVTDMCKMCTCSLLLLTETPRYSTAYYKYINKRHFYAMCAFYAIQRRFVHFLKKVLVVHVARVSWVVARVVLYSNYGV